MTEQQKIALYMKQAKNMTLVELLVDRGGWKPDTASWQVVDREIARRDAFSTEVRAWIAFGVALVSLCVAIFAAIRATGVSGS